MAVVRVAFFLSTGGVLGDAAEIRVTIRFRCIKLLSRSATISTFPFCWAYPANPDKQTSRLTHAKPILPIVFVFVLCAVAIFIFFAASTWTGIVSPYFLLVADWL